MALTDAQKADIRRALGWSARFHQFDSRLEQAMSAVENDAESEAQITETQANHGILANIEAIATEVTAARARLKADKVGSILLRKEEIRQLRKEGDSWVEELAKLLGVETRNGGRFGGARVGSFAGFGGLYGCSNYVGK